VSEPAKEKGSRWYAQAGLAVGLAAVAGYMDLHGHSAALLWVGVAALVWNVLE
jgi:hypothetical protein